MPEIKKEPMSPEEAENWISQFSTADINRLMMWARRIGGGLDMQAGDLVQEALVRTIAGVRTISPNVAPLAHMFGAIKSIANSRRKELKGHESKNETEGDHKLEWAQGVPPPPPDEQLLRTQERDAMVVAIEELLTDNEPAWFVFTFLLEKKSPEEIQKEMNLTKTEYATIRRYIRRKISEQYPNGWA